MAGSNGRAHYFSSEALLDDTHRRIALCLIVVIIGGEDAQTVLARRKRPGLPESFLRASVFNMIGDDEGEDGPQTVIPLCS